MVTHEVDLFRYFIVFLRIILYVDRLFVDAGSGLSELELNS